MDFTHDVLLHPFADAAVLGTHEQSVFYQTSKLRAFLVHDTEYLVLKEKIHVCGVFHIRRDSYVFHIFTVGMIITVAVWVGSSDPALPHGWEKRAGIVSGTPAVFKRLFRYQVSPLSGR